MRPGAARERVNDVAGNRGHRVRRQSRPLPGLPPLAGAPSRCLAANVGLWLLLRERVQCTELLLGLIGSSCRARSVIKIILQFCKENGLSESFNAIQVSALQTLAGAE